MKIFFDYFAFAAAFLAALWFRHLSAHELSLLTHTVVDDDGIVQRVTQDHQHDGDEIGVDRPAEDNVEEINQRYVVEQCDQSHHTG